MTTSAKENSKKGWRATAIAWVCLGFMLSGCSHQQVTFVPNGELEFCREQPDSAICIGIFKQAATEVLERFRYRNDAELYGVEEHWSDLVMDRGRLLGDCEDCAITLANELVAAGLPAQHIALYLAAKNRRPDHIIIRYGRYFVDCGNKTISRETPYQLVSRRVITSGQWESYRSL